MKRLVQVSKLSVVALLGGLAAVSATSAQAGRRALSYDPAFAYTGDPAYEQSRAEVRGAPARQQIQQGAARGLTPPNLPYPDRPYGDPDRW